MTSSPRLISGITTRPKPVEQEPVRFGSVPYTFPSLLYPLGATQYYPFVD